MNCPEHRKVTITHIQTAVFKIWPRAEKVRIRISFYAFCFSPTPVICFKAQHWVSNFDKIFIRRNRSLITTAPGDKKTTESLTDFYSPGCLIFAFPTHPPRQLWVWLWSQLLVLVWRVVGFVRSGWERGGGGGTIRRSFIAATNFFSLPIIYFSFASS